MSDLKNHHQILLHPTYRTQSYHNLNSNENLEMVVGVANNGEHAYETLLTILLPTGVAFVALRTQVWLFYKCLEITTNCMV